MLFESCSFCLDLGKAVSFKTVLEFKKLITGNGGTVTTLLSAKVTCLVNSAFEYEVASSNLHQKARLLGVPIVSVEFLTQCVPAQRRLDALSLLHLYGKYAPASAMVAEFSAATPSDPVLSSLKFLRESEARALRTFDACLMEIGHVFSALVADPQRVLRCCRETNATKNSTSGGACGDDGMSDEEPIEASECESVDSTSSASSTSTVAFRLSIPDIAFEFYRQRIFQQTNANQADPLVAALPAISPPFESFSSVPMQMSVQHLTQDDASIDAPALIQQQFASSGPIDNSIEAIRARFQAQYNARLDEQAERKLLQAKIQMVAELEKEQRIIARQARIVSEEAQMKEHRERIRAQKQEYIEKKRIHELLTKAMEKGHILVDLLAFRPGDCLHLMTSETHDDSSGRAMLEQIKAQLDEYEYDDEYDYEAPLGVGEYMWNKGDLSHYMASNLFDLPPKPDEPTEAKQEQGPPLAQPSEAPTAPKDVATPVPEVEAPKPTPPAKKKKVPNPNPNYIGQKLFIGGLKFDDIYAMGKPENFDHHYDVWKEEKVNERVQQRVELIKEMLSYFGEIIQFEEKDLAKKGFLFVVYKSKEDANTAHKTIMNESLKTAYFEEERRRIRYSGVDMIIFPNKAEMYSSWPKHVKDVYQRRKKKAKK